MENQESQNRRESRRSAELRSKIQALMAQSPRRIVPADLRKLVLNPIGTFIMFMGFFLIVLCLFLYFFLDKQRSASPSTVKITFGILPAVGLILIGWAIFTRNRVTGLLSDGLTAVGRILKVQPLSVFINGRSFYKVQVVVELSDGRNLPGWDIVDNTCVETFIEMRDNETPVDMIYHPRKPGRMVLLDRLLLDHRFD